MILSFHEVMSGILVRPGETGPRPFELDFLVQAPRLRDFLRTGLGRATGRVHLGGLAGSAPAQGTLELLPFTRRRIRYWFSFRGDDGQTYQFDGEKRIRRFRGAIRSWTTLLGELRADDGALYGRAELHFRFAQHLGPLVRSIRFDRRLPAPAAPPAAPPAVHGAG
jgi:hypothetical protein